jgi:integrase/recombinase XerD
LFYSVIIHQPDKLKNIPYPIINQKLPAIIAKEILLKKIAGVGNKKDKAILATLFSTGVRVAECCELKIVNINSARMEITVREGKGNKDRIVPLAQTLLIILRRYIASRPLVMRPVEFLFENSPHRYHSASTIQRICRKHLDAHPHQIRHCFAVAFIEEGGSIFVLQKILGHKNIKTTLRYLQLTNTMFASSPNPIDGLLQAEIDQSKQHLRLVVNQ